MAPLVTIQIGARERRADMRPVEAEQPHPPQHDNGNTGTKIETEGQQAKDGASEKPEQVIPWTDNPLGGCRSQTFFSIQRMASFIPSTKRRQASGSTINGGSMRTTDQSCPQT